MSSHCCHAEAQPEGLPKIGSRLLIVGGIFVAVLALSFLEPFAALNEAPLGYVAIIWWAVLLGLVLGGIIDYFVPDGFIIVLLTGLVFSALDRLELIEGPATTAQPDDVSWDRLTRLDVGKAAKGVLSGSISLANMVLWWILIGVLAAAIIGAYVPEHFFMQWMGPDFAGMLVTVPQILALGLLLNYLS